MILKCNQDLFFFNGVVCDKIQYCWLGCWVGGWGGHRVNITCDILVNMAAIDYFIDFVFGLMSDVFANSFHLKYWCWVFVCFFSTMCMVFCWFIIFYIYILSLYYYLIHRSERCGVRV